MQVLYDPFFQQRSLNQLLNSMYQFAAFKQRQKEQEEGRKFDLQVHGYSEKPTYTETPIKNGGYRISPLTGEREYTRKTTDEPDVTTPGGARFWEKPDLVKGDRIVEIPGLPPGMVAVYNQDSKTIKLHNAPNQPRESAPKTVDVYNASTGRTDIYTIKKNDEGRWVRGDKVGEKAPNKGLNVSVDKEGNVNLSMGGQLTPANQTKVQQEIMTDTDRLARINSVMENYDPTYQEVQTRVGMDWTAFKDKFKVGTPVTPEQRQALSDYTTYKKQAVAELGNQIHELAGSALSRQEEKIFKGGLPNPGTGWFDGDSPTEYEAAVRSTVKNLVKSIARKRYYLTQLNYDEKELKGLLEKNGVMSLDRFEDEMDKKAEAYAAKLKQQNPQLSPVQIKTAVRDFLKKEFGFEF